VLAAQKHADGVRDDVLVRFDEMTRVAQTLSRLPADLAALNSRLTEVDARFPKDQARIRSRWRAPCVHG
jgi:hypothetical protein